MKSIFTNLMILVAVVSVTCVLTGCEAEKKLAECKQNAAELQEKLDANEAEIAKLKLAEHGYGMALIETMTSNEELDKENKALKQENAKLIKARIRTPAQEENIRKGLKDLRKLQRENAERLQKEATKKPAE